MKAKDRHRINLLEYLANPLNEFLSREKLAEKVLRIRSRTLRNHFTPDELSQIEQEALVLRRNRCAALSARVDRGLINRAIDGDPAACKLYYQRIEGWTEKQARELTGKDGGPIETKGGLSPEAEQKLMELIGSQ